MKISTALSTLTVLALAAPASALAQNPKTAPPAREAQAPTAASDPDRMICVQAVITGSRLPRRICRTAAEWALDGEVPAAR